MKNTHVSRSGGGHARYEAEYKHEALKLCKRPVGVLIGEGRWMA